MYRIFITSIFFLSFFWIFSFPFHRITNTSYWSFVIYHYFFNLLYLFIQIYCIFFNWNLLYLFFFKFIVFFYYIFLIPHISRRICFHLYNFLCVLFYLQQTQLGIFFPQSKGSRKSNFFLSKKKVELFYTNKICLFIYLFSHLLN